MEKVKKKTAISFNKENKNKKSLHSYKDASVTASLPALVSAPLFGHIIPEPYPQRRSRITQNFRLVWLDITIDEVNDNDSRNTITELRQIVNTINTFVDPKQCEVIMPDMHGIPHLKSIYIFCKNKSRYQHLVSKKWSKIKGVYTEISYICEQLKQASQQCDQDSIPISFVSTNSEALNGNFDQLNQLFMYTQILKEIILNIDFSKKYIKDFTAYCRDQFFDNKKELNSINEFEHKYRNDTAIWWYTNECFLYPMLNRALRMMEVDTIIKMGFFVRDLHQHIAELHKKQYKDIYQMQSFIVYRGQGLSKVDFDEMIKTKGGLISFNNFLSSSKKQNIALIYAHRALADSDSMGIVFQMTIDPSISSTPFALINDVSFYKESEQEILFCMHAVFRIGEISQMDDKSNRLWEVKLTLTSDNDPQLNALTHRVREETRGSKGWYCLGQLLIKLGQFDKAEELYKVLLDHALDKNEKGGIYHQLGCIQDNLGDYKKAISFYEKSLAITEKILPPNDLDLAATYGNIGLVYDRMGEYTEALLFHEKARKIYEMTFPLNYPDLATSFNNIGLVYYKMEDYDKALSYHKLALEIYKKTFPSNDLLLATSYSNIGLVHDKKNDYSTAFWHYEKALEIYRKVLPPDHPDLASCYQNIGRALETMCEYWRALPFHEKALESFQKMFPPNHPHLATCYSCIASVYNSMGEHLKALSFYEQALNIRQKNLPSNHPDLITSNNSIAGVYDHMKEYSNALVFYQKALDICQRTLTPNHPLLASSYNNIGKVHYSMGRYNEARSFFEHAVYVGLRALPPDHLDLQMYKKALQSVKLVL